MSLSFLLLFPQANGAFLGSESKKFGRYRKQFRLIILNSSSHTVEFRVKHEDVRFL